MKDFRKYKYCYLALIGILLITGCSREERKLVSGEALGTTYHISYYSDKDIALEVALDSIIERVNRSMSTYRSDSDISKVNRGETEVRVDSLFRRVFQLSQEVHQSSGGFFDPTVGKLVNYYGFGPDEQFSSPDSAEVDSLMQYVGLEKIKIDQNGSVSKQHPEIFLDFNAIAKGYAIDLIGHYLNQMGVESYLVELGGELLAKGKKPGKDNFWVVGIDDPEATPENRKTIIKVILQNEALATSGNYRKNRIDAQTGKMYVHTVNPLTGYAKKSDLLSASVVADNCALADAYATAFMAMGYQKALDLLSQNKKLEAFLIYATEDGGTATYATPGFQDKLVK